MQCECLAKWGANTDVAEASLLRLSVQPLCSGRDSSGDPPQLCTNAQIVPTVTDNGLADLFTDYERRLRFDTLAVHSPTLIDPRLVLSGQSALFSVRS